MAAKWSGSSAFAAVAIVLAACDNVMGPIAPDANWRVHDSSHFALHVRPGSFADQQAPQLGQVLDEHYESARRTLGLTYDGRISAFLYSSRADMKPYAETDYSGMGFPDTEAMSAVCVPPLGANLAGLLTHEANHVIMGRGIGRHGTSFMSEGMASAVMSSAYYPELVTNVHDWARRNRSRLVSIRRLADDDQWNGFAQDVSYRTSASFLLFVLDRYGAAAVRQLYTVPSASFERRAQEITGRSLDQLEAEWLRFLDT